MKERSNGWRRARVAILTLVTLVIVAHATTAQTQRGQRGRGGALERFMFAPALVMGHQQEIGLTAKQKDEVIRQMQVMQSELVPLQIEMSEATETLGRLLREPLVDEDAAVATARQVMALESEIKTRHLLLVVRIKNLLSPEQQSTLRDIRARQRARQDR